MGSRSRRRASSGTSPAAGPCGVGRCQPPPCFVPAWSGQGRAGPGPWGRQECAAGSLLTLRSQLQASALLSRSPTAPALCARWAGLEPRHGRPVMWPRSGPGPPSWPGVGGGRGFPGMRLCPEPGWPRMWCGACPLPPGARPCPAVRAQRGRSCSWLSHPVPGASTGGCLEQGAPALWLLLLQGQPGLEGPSGPCSLPATLSVPTGWHWPICRLRPGRQPVPSSCPACLFLS